MISGAPALSAPIVFTLTATASIVSNVSGAPALSAPVFFMLTATAEPPVPPPDNRAPVAIDPRIEIDGATLRALYRFYDADGDAENVAGRALQWFRDQGAGFAHVAAYDGVAAITPAIVTGDRWRFDIAVHDGLELGRVETSAIAYIGDEWEITIIVDDGARTHSIAARCHTRGARKAVRFSVLPEMRGRMVRTRLGASASTRLHGFDYSVSKSPGTIR